VPRPRTGSQHQVVLVFHPVKLRMFVMMLSI
jgi:hypothetical protein